jgi:hypothetical protein
MHCHRKYTPAPKLQGYPESLRKRAAEMYVDGMNLRLFAFCYHSRQLYKQRYPNYPAHVMDFVSPPL